MDDAGMLMLLGWCVVECGCMPDDGCLVTTQRIALVRATLSPERRAATLADLLTSALECDALDAQPRPE